MVSKYGPTIKIEPSVFLKAVQLPWTGQFGFTATPNFGTKPIGGSLGPFQSKTAEDSN